MGVCTDGTPKTLRSRSGIVARTKQGSPNEVETCCVIHHDALTSRTLPGTMKDKLAIAICVVNFVKISSVKSRLFTTMRKDLDADHKTLLFHTVVRWLAKGNMLTRVYVLRKKVELLLEAPGN